VQKLGSHQHTAIQNAAPKTCIDLYARATTSEKPSNNIHRPPRTGAVQRQHTTQRSPPGAPSRGHAAPSGYMLGMQVMHQNTASRYMCACCAWIGTSHVNDHVRRRRLNGQAGTTSSSITPDGTTTSSCMTKLNITTTGEKRYQRHLHASRCGTLLSRLLQQGTVSELRREKGHLQVRHHRRHVCCPDITHTLSPRSTT
jgi:hypothetical protein